MKPGNPTLPTSPLYLACLCTMVDSSRSLRASGIDRWTKLIGDLIIVTPEIIVRDISLIYAMNGRIAGAPGPTVTANWYFDGSFA